MTRRVRLPAIGLALVILLSGVAQVAAVAPGNAAFQSRWERTDYPVLQGALSRTWIWGPEANTAILQERYDQSPGGMRQVQYFDKSRMEINNPAGNPNDLFYVTNGLLVVELMTGRLQLGDNTFEQHLPAMVNVAGDGDDPTGPTYATMAELRNLPPLGNNALITQRVNRAGVVTNDPSLSGQGVMTAQRLTVPGIDHQIAAPFWNFMTSSGLVYSGGGYTTEALFTNPYYATGFPVTEAYWANVKIANTYRDVLMQCFERRCLTFTPGNPDGFATEAGNVGQHYYQWRYVDILNEGPATEYEYKSQFGLPSDPSRDMGAPTGVTFDALGNMYVTDAEKDRVQKYDTDGLFLTQWGSEGAGNDQFNNPTCVTASMTGSIYVCDFDNDRVQVFDNAGMYLSTIGSPGAGDGELDGPTGIVFDSFGNMLVTDYFNHRVQRFDPDGMFLSSFGSFGAGDEQFNSPSDLAIDDEDNVYVADEMNNRVQVWSVGGGFTNRWAADSPVSIYADYTNDLVYTYSAGNLSITVGLVDGAFVREIGGPDIFSGPVDIGIRAGYGLYAAEAFDSRVQILSPETGIYRGQITGDSRGRFLPGGADGIGFNAAGEISVIDSLGGLLKTWDVGAGFEREWGSGPRVTWAIARDFSISLSGTYYVADEFGNRIVTYDPDGTMIGGWGSPGTGAGEFAGATGVSVDPAGNVYVTDLANNRVQKFTSTGVYLTAWGMTGDGPGEFSTPMGIHATATHVYVVDAANDRVQVFDPSGVFQFEFGSTGSGDGEFLTPWRVVVDEDGYIYVTDRGNHRVQKFTPDGEYLAQFGSFGSGDGQLDTPTGIALGPNGDVVVSDSFNSRVVTFGVKFKF